MPQSLVHNLIHLVYGTEDRRRWITDDVRPRLHAYQTGIFKKWDSPLLEIGGTDDHVHTLFSLSKNCALAKVVEEVKKGSSIWIKSESPRYADFAWQKGYAAFSVSESNARSVKAYIANQEAHHQKMDFDVECAALFRKHGIVLNEGYPWG
ncbi:MAG: IS200/IS605 family transposase [Planctomycetota bacterium]